MSCANAPFKFSSPFLSKIDFLKPLKIKIFLGEKNVEFFLILGVGAGAKFEAGAVVSLAAQNQTAPQRWLKHMRGRGELCYLKPCYTSNFI